MSCAYGNPCFMRAWKTWNWFIRNINDPYWLVKAFHTCTTGSIVKAKFCAFKYLSVYKTCAMNFMLLKTSDRSQQSRKQSSGNCGNFLSSNFALHVQHMRIKLWKVERASHHRIHTFFVAQRKDSIPFLNYYSTMVAKKSTLARCFWRNRSTRWAFPTNCKNIPSFILC